MLTVSSTQLHRANNPQGWAFRLGAAMVQCHWKQQGTARCEWHGKPSRGGKQKRNRTEKGKGASWHNDFQGGKQHARKYSSDLLQQSGCSARALGVSEKFIIKHRNVLVTQKCKTGYFILILYNLTSQLGKTLLNNFLP